MKYLIYYADEALHHEVYFREIRELEKFITSAAGGGLIFKEEPEAGAVFFTDRQGNHIGFYMEDNNE
jgi:hypothetical protein